MGFLTLTQYILLDPILLCFLMGSILGTVKVSYSSNKEFSFLWWFWLIFTGTMLSCCISVKFVGLFIVLWVGIRTVADLWNMLGDLTRPVVRLLIKNKYLVVFFFIIKSSRIKPTVVMQQTWMNSRRFNF